MNTKDKQAIMLYKQGYSIIQIAQVLGMDSSYVDALVQKDEQEQGKEIRLFTVEDDESHKIGRKTKLKREKFEEMKRLLAQGLSVREVAPRIGFSWQYIHKIKRFKTYDELMEYRKEDAAKRREANSTSRQRNRMTEELWNKAMQLKRKGMSKEDIASELGFSLMFIYKATRFKTYEDFQECRRKEVLYKRERYQLEQPDSAMPEPKKEAEKDIEQPKSLEETLAKHMNPSDDLMYMEIRSIAGSLARIAEALEKIAEQPKKRRFFKR